MIGLLGRKKGMSAVYDAKGRATPVTVLAVGPCTIMDVKTREAHSYEALRLAFEPARETRITRPVSGEFKKREIGPHRIIREFRGATGDYKPGSVVTVEIFQPGERIKVIGTSKGRGFAGVIKRHNFGRPNQSHGTHESFRGSGSIGQHSYPARTWPGQRMAGRMGGAKVTLKKVLVVGVDVSQGLLMVKGAVPGAPGGLVTVQKIG